MEYAIEVEGLTKHYKGFTLDNVSFRLPSGCIMGFIGENGAGKSTTIRLLLGLARADSGARPSAWRRLWSAARRAAWSATLRALRTSSSII